MVKIRLKRIGRKSDPSFRIVAAEVTAPPHGKSLENLGFYNPKTKELTLNKERIKEWISNGAQPTPRVHNMLINEKVIEGEKIPVHSRKPSKKQKEGEGEEKEAPKEAAKKEEAPKEESAEQEDSKKEPKQETPAEEKTEDTDKDIEKKEAEPQKKEQKDEQAKEDKKEEAEAAPEEKKKEAESK